MSNVPGELSYSKDHEWVRMEEDGTVTVGVTDHAQAALGDLVFVELPEVGATLSEGDACAVVESVKAASDVYCPVSGEVVEVNEAVVDAPETVNQDPYGDGWLFKLQPVDAGEVEDLLNAESYTEVTEEDDH